MKYTSLIAVLFLTLATPAFAHDASMHKGIKIEGKLLEKSENSFQLETETGKINVLFSDATKFELGMDGKPGTKSQLNLGDFLMVEGHKMPGNAFGASSVMIHSAESTSETHQ